MRNIININKNWTFTKQGEYSTVDLPHTWNGSDGQDGGNDYYRGTCIYKKSMAKSDFPDGEVFYINLTV